MQVMCNYMQEITGCLTFTKLLKLSSNSRHKCRFTVNEQHTVPMYRNIDKVTSRINESALSKTLHATCIRHFHYKNPRVTCGLIKQYTNSYQRYMTIDTSSDTVEDTNATENNSSGIESLVGKMLEKAGERDVMVAMVPKPTLAKYVKMLLNNGFTEADILYLSKYPKLVKDLAQVVEVVEILLEHGLQKEDITHIMKIYPDIMHKTKTDILFKIEMLQNQGLASDAIIRMICKQPDLLDKDLTGVSQRIEELKYLFKTKDTFRLLEQYPVLLYCDMDYITQRFNYVFHEMGITQPQMKYSDVFSFSMDHIHARHMFLVRAGFFKKLKKKEGQRDLNPKLNQILDTSDEEFVTMFGDMTVTDYETFKQLLVKDRVVIDVEDYTDDEN